MSLQFTPPVILSPTSVDNAPTPTLAVVTLTPTLDDSTAITTSLPTVQPAVSIISLLPPAQQQVVQAAALGIVQVAKQLPLLVRDSFDTNDYGWLEFHNTIDQGIECGGSLTESKYNIFVKSTSQVGSWCIPFVPGSAKEFYLSVETELVEDRNTEIHFYYRHVDENNFNYMILDPRSQVMTLGIKLAGTDHAFVASQFTPSIHKDGINKFTIIVTGGSHAIYINDSLDVLMSNENTLGEGRFRWGIRLYEANETQELLLDNYEVRGD